MFSRSRSARSSPLRPILIFGLFVVLVPARVGADTGSIDLDLYTSLLQTRAHETNSKVGVHVDYADLVGDPDLATLVRQVEGARPSRLERNERIAFWINAYNILTLDLIARHYPIDGIKDIGSFFSPVWNREVATIEGRSVTLGSIEHEILRPTGEARIHAAIVCASISCPPLSRTPFRATRLDADLDAAMRNWLSSHTKGVRIDRNARRVTVSKIFDWFEDDFEAFGGVLPTIAKYVDAADAEWLRTAGKSASIEHFDYDWNLNDSARR